MTVAPASVTMGLAIMAGSCTAAERSDATATPLEERKTPGKRETDVPGSRVDEKPSPTVKESLVDCHTHLGFVPNRAKDLFVNSLLQSLSVKSMPARFVGWSNSIIKLVPFVSKRQETIAGGEKKENGLDAARVTPSLLDTVRSTRASPRT